MSTIAPARARTEPPEHGAQQHREKRNLHQRLHSSSLRNRAFTASGKDHGYRHAARETVQSAIELRPPISFDRLLRREKDTTDSSRRGSRDQHRHAATADDNLDGSAHGSSPHPRGEALSSSSSPPPQQVPPAAIERLRAQNAQRAAELRRSLKSVEETAMRSTRQLDDTYYTILEKAAGLRAIVAGLQQLADETRALHAAFRHDTAALAADAELSVAGFGDFAAPAAAVDALVARLGASQARTHALNGRLEAARTRVADYEQREQARQKTRRKRWQMSWTAVVGFVVLLVALAVVRRRAALGSRLHTAANAVNDFGSEIVSPVTALLKPTSSPSEDAYLRSLFDDL